MAEPGLFLDSLSDSTHTSHAMELGVYGMLGLRVHGFEGVGCEDLGVAGFEGRGVEGPSLPYNVHMSHAVAELLV